MTRNAPLSHVIHHHHHPESERFSGLSSYAWAKISQHVTIIVTCVRSSYFRSSGVRSVGELGVSDGQK